jgi:hypothetical protein
MGYRIVLAGGILAVLGWIAFAASTTAMAAPSISVTPNEGPAGTRLTISGQGFQPDETIYLGIAPLGALGEYGIGTISADAAGGFVVSAEVGIVYTGPNLPDPAPPGQGERVNLAPGDYQILAYPGSFGGRTPETIAKAPKASFQVTGSTLPNTGGSPHRNDSGQAIGVIAGLALMAGGFCVWRKASVRVGSP